MIQTTKITSIFVMIINSMLIPNSVVGFSSLQPPSSSVATKSSISRKSLQLNYFMHPANDDGGNHNYDEKDDATEKELQELEKARKAFEALLQDTASTTSGMMFPGAIRNGKDNDNTVMTPINPPSKQRPSPTILTNAGRRFREIEMDLLHSLQYTDDAIEELIHLWTTEKDEKSASSLLALQEDEGCSHGLVHEEMELRRLCQEHPDWAEPFSRLSTLLYYKQGRTDEAIHCAVHAITIKPWHFEALNMCYLLRHRRDGSIECYQRAEELAHYAMPPLLDSEARRAWVARALSQAAKQLEDAEKATIQHQNERHNNDLNNPIMSRYYAEGTIWQ